MKDRYAPYFLDAELACKCGCGRGADDMRPTFMSRMINLRIVAKFPFIITSAFRCPDYNDAIYVQRGSLPGTHRDGPHTKSAIDILVYGLRAYRLVALALDWNFTGIGINQKGPYAQRYVHIDDLAHGESGPRPWIWTY